LETYGKIDSKFRFVIVAAKRAKQLLKGARPKVKAKSKNPIRLAQAEVKKGLVDYDVLLPKQADVLEGGGQVFTTAAEEAEEADEAAGAEDTEEFEESEGEPRRDEDVDYEDGFPAEGGDTEKDEE
jgi:DNA-directed RNA polymerase omega subunit